AIGTIPPLLIRDRTAPAGTNAVKSSREVWFRQTGATPASVYDRRRMPAGLVAPGPSIIESLESTILVPPDWQATMNDDGFVVLTRSPSPRLREEGHGGAVPPARGEGQRQAAAQVPAPHPSPLPAKVRGEGTRA